MPPITKKVKDTNVAKSIDPFAIYSSGKERPVLYPKYHTKIHCLPDGDNEYDGPITMAMAKKVLGWELESEYVTRMKDSGLKLKEIEAKFERNYTLKDYQGKKVVCWHNAKNRPFDPNHAKSIAQDILNLNWEMNLENIIIGRTGLVLSGQHRLVALVLAVEEWYATKLKDGSGFWTDKWPEEPVLESVVAFGAKEDARVMRTYDNVKARTLADTVFTSPMFHRITSLAERKEVCRMMDSCVDLLWKRTKQNDNGYNKHQTHSSSIDFADKHPYIQKCVKQIFDNNRDRIISNLYLSPGSCAAMMYLMGCSATNREDYDYPGSKREGKQLNWTNWDKAVEFWNGLVDSKNEGMDVVRAALANLTNPDTGASAKDKIKNMVLSHAWNAYVAGEEITEETLSLDGNLTWSEAKQRTIISEEVTVGGIDCGVVKGGGEEDEVMPSPEDIKNATKEMRASKDEDIEDDENDIEEEEDTPTLPAKKSSVPFTPEERAKELAKVPLRGPNNEQPRKAVAKKPTSSPK